MGENEKGEDKVRNEVSSSDRISLKMCDFNEMCVSVIFFLCFQLENFVSSRKL